MEREESCCPHFIFVNSLCSSRNNWIFTRFFSSPAHSGVHFHYSAHYSKPKVRISNFVFFPGKREDEKTPSTTLTPVCGCGWKISVARLTWMPCVCVSSSPLLPLPQRRKKCHLDLLRINERISFQNKRKMNIEKKRANERKLSCSQIFYSSYCITN